MKIAFIDGIGGNYNGETLLKQAKIGGTEITVIRVAELLARVHEVFVFQQICHDPARIGGVNYQQLDGLKNFTPDVIIGIRARRHIISIARQFPDIRCFYWMHDIPSRRLWKYKHKFYKAGCSIIAISNYQTGLINKAWKGNFWQRIMDRLFKTGPVPIYVIYNPVSDALKPDPRIAIDRNKLIFFSAPDRGLPMILDNFFELLAHMPQFRLYIAHPGYASLDAFKDRLKHPNISVLGTLPNADILREVRESLCVFYPQNTKPECFGLVYAESNAVGTPVLGHDFGAAKEVLSTPDQLVDATDITAVIGRLTAWQTSRPNISLRPELTETGVFNEWQQLLHRFQ